MADRDGSRANSAIPETRPRTEGERPSVEELSNQQATAFSVTQSGNFRYVNGLGGLAIASTPSMVLTRVSGSLRATVAARELIESQSTIPDT